MNKIFKHIITDIEGTTSSISFVQDILFPYSKNKLNSFVKENEDRKEVKKILESIEANYQSTSLEQSLKLLHSWIDNDQKIKELKELQGLIWQNGYSKQDFYGHIYEDAYQALKDWHNSEIQIFVYSSGSILAQKLLFGHTKYGDLNYLFTGNFDTTIGHKKEVESYKKILDTIKAQSTQEVLFLSDTEAELDAAYANGIEVIQVIRDQTKPGKYKSINSFSSVFMI